MTNRLEGAYWSAEVFGKDGGEDLVWVGLISVR